MKEKKHKKISGKIWKNNTENSSILKEVAKKNEQFILENMKLVYFFRNKFLNMGINIPFEDMDQIGYIAMLKAIRSFDSSFSRGAFSVYFKYKFRGELMREYKTNYYSGACRPPIHYWEEISKVIRYIKVQQKKYGYKPDTAEIARAVKMRKSRVEFCLKTLGQKTKTSLSEKKSGDGGGTLIDFLPDQSPFDQKDLAVLYDWSEKFIAGLKKSLPVEGRNRTIIVRRIKLVDYGNSAKSKVSLKDVSQSFEITKERVRQIETRFAHDIHYKMDLENLYGVKKEKVCGWIRDVVSLIRELDAKYNWGIDFGPQT
jgi:RNA polymerase sigma factor (sigma-70 family)